jgi:hypothetical protein
MYIDQLRLKNVRTFVDESLDFVHPDRPFRARGKPTDNGSPLLPRPRLPNVNLLLGENGSGKSTVLRAIAMAALGPSFEDSKLPTSGLVRRSPSETYSTTKGEGAQFEANLLLHDQDCTPGKRLRSAFSLTRRGELERATHLDVQDHVWKPVFESNNPAFFAVGYGPTRRVESSENINLVTWSTSGFLRALRLVGLFQESYYLTPLRAWLPNLRALRVEREEVLHS